MSDNKMTHEQLIQEIECELNSVEDNCRNAHGYADEAEGNSYEAKEAADDARYSAERALELMKQIKPENCIKVYVLYIGGIVDSYHQDERYIKMFAELFPALQDSLAVEKYWVKDLSQMIDFMGRIAGADTRSTSEGIISRLHETKKDRFKNYDRDIRPVTIGGLERVAFWRNNSAGNDLCDWLGIEPIIDLDVSTEHKMKQEREENKDKEAE